MDFGYQCFSIYLLKKPDSINIVPPYFYSCSCGVNFAIVLNLQLKPRFGKLQSLSYHQ